MKNPSKNRKLCKRTLLILGIILLAGLADSNIKTDELSSNSNFLIHKPFAGTSHVPILITSNGQIASYANGGGTGESWDPYILENYEIIANPTEGIKITGTDAYIIIRNCTIGNGAGSYKSGIFLQNCKNVKIENCTSNNNFYGVVLYTGCSDIFVENSNCSFNSASGVYLNAAANNTIFNVYCTNNSYGLTISGNSYNNTIQAGSYVKSDNSGIMFEDAYNNTIIETYCAENGDFGIEAYHSGYLTDHNILLRNTVTQHYWDGIHLTNARNYTIQENRIFDNRRYGLILSSCFENNITLNNCTDNQFGLSFWSCQNNSVWENNFYNNSDDIGCFNTNINTWSHEGFGNYYGDYGGIDANGDGIGDTPYEISSDNDDPYPLMYLSPDLEFPSWTQLPQDQFFFENVSVYYDVNATDNAGIRSYTLNSSMFAISSQGEITNATHLDLGDFVLEVNVSDVKENTISITLTISIIKDTGFPVWDQPLENHSLFFGEDFWYDVNASDNVGIGYYGVNGTIFTIDEAGIITNSSVLEVGNYSLEISATDINANTISQVIHISVEPMERYFPIVINGNAEIAPYANGRGSGTQFDPYIIQYYYIDAHANTGINISNTDAYITVQYCEIANGSIGGYSGVYVYNSDNIQFINNTFQDNQYGIYVKSSSYYLDISNNSIQNMVMDGIYFDQIAYYSNIAHNNITSCGGNGIYDYGGDYNTIRYNLISSCEGNGIYLHFFASNNYVENNSIFENLEHGIHMSNDADSNVVRYNNISNNGNQGIRLYWYGNNNLITYNRLINNSGTALSIEGLCELNTVRNNEMIGSGIYLRGETSTSNNNIFDSTNTINGKPLLYYRNVPDLVLSGKIFTSVGQIILVGCDNFSISDFTISKSANAIELIDCSNGRIENNNFTGNTMHGIYFAVDSYDVVIKNNNLSLNSLSGLYTYNVCDNFTITNNIFNNNGENGIDVRYLDNSILADNQITHNLGKGIYMVQYCDYNHIYRNNITDNTDMGLHLYIGCKNNLIWVNNIYNNDITNSYQAYEDSMSSDNAWDNGTFGNYWGANYALYEIDGYPDDFDYHPLNQSIYSDVDLDTLSLVFEILISFTDPNLNDTDEDGIDDGTEVREGTNPNDHRDPDVYAPEVSILSPVPNGEYNYTTLLFNISAIDRDHAIHTVIVEIEGMMNISLSWTSDNYYATTHDISPGSYTIRFLVNDTEGNLNITDSFTVIIDLTPPTINILQPSSPTNNNGTITVSLSSIGGAIALQYFIEGVDATNISWVKPINRTLSDGSYIIHAYGWDVAGNMGETSFSFLIDTVFPAISILQPTTAIINKSIITVSLSSTGAAIAQQYYIQGVDATNISWVEPINRTLSDGTYTLHAYCWDVAGNMAESSFNFTIDTLSPVINIDTPTLIKTSNSSITISLSASEDIAEYWYFIEDVDFINQTWNAPEIRELTEGAYVIHAYGKDSAHNVGYTNFSFQIDTTPPEISIISPLAEVYFTTEINIILHVGDDAESVLFFVENVDTQNQSYVGETIRTFPEGSYIFHVFANDSVGNWIHLTTSFIVDDTPPSVLILSPQSEEYSENLIEIVFLPSEDAISVQYFIEGYDSLNITWSTPISRSLPNGEYTLYVYVEDAYGRIGSSQVSFLIETETDITPTTSTTESDIPLSLAGLLLILGLSVGFVSIIILILILRRRSS